MADDVTVRELRDQHYTEFGLVELWYNNNTTQWEVDSYVKSDDIEVTFKTLSYDDAKEDYDKHKAMIA